jgi:hypothetical protein
VSRSATLRSSSWPSRLLKACLIRQTCNHKHAVTKPQEPRGAPPTCCRACRRVTSGCTSRSATLKSSS